ncbi:S8 family serine peptidase [Streptomyces sp. NPDC019224]|uniref:S8 family peptidase n=1 Tax=Streptomyces sp. NPDC019224 TaxID=3154484 RepID=UPI0033D673F5
MTRSRPRLRYLPAATATALALGGALLVTPPAAADSTSGTVTGAAAAPAPAGQAAHDITLITGDVVHYTDRPGDQDDVTVDRAPGAHGGVSVQSYGHHTYVIPTEAMGLIASGKLDAELFNVTGLVAMGYDDARSGGIPVIAGAPNGRSAEAPAAPAGASRVRKFDRADATAMKADAGHARAFWKDIAPAAGAKTRGFAADSGIGKLWLDGKVEVALSDSVAQVRAPEAWAKGLDGTGSKVAVLDTGVDATHPDLKDAVVAEKSFVPGETADDRHGHGTHVASTIAGSGAASDGKEKGVAPGAKLYIGKVLSDTGDGSQSGILAGMEWAREQGVDVVSMSLGSSASSDGTDPLSLAVDRLSADGGPLFVVAAGNNYTPGSIGSPGAAASALTVGAVDQRDSRAAFSSQGPVAHSYALKPDISAPGVSIRAAAAHPADGAPMYQSMSGTSMATPHVAGGAAILHQAHPDWDADRIKNALMTSSKKLSRLTPYQQGAGRMDVTAALESTIEAPGSVPAAAFKWPNADAGPVDRTLTYRNTGSADVTLDLSTDTTGSTVSLSDASVTVPAGGSAQVTVRLDPTGLPPSTAATALSGQVTATDRATGKTAAHTAYALFKEPEAYDYTIELTDRDGKPATGTVALTYPGNAAPGFVAVYGSTTLRLPPRSYTAFGFLDVNGDDPGDLGMAMLVAPDIAVGPGHEKATARLDATEASRVRVTTPRETETAQTVVQYRRSLAGGGALGSAFVLDKAYTELYVSPTPQTEDGVQDLLVHWQLRQKFLDAATGTGRTVELTGQNGTAYHDGHRILRTVYAGAGTPADYARLNAKGKAVVVDRGTSSPAGRAQAAADAGAAMLITVGDQPGRLYETFGDNHGLSLASTGSADGARLIKEARTGFGILNLTEHRYPDYQYDLLQYQKGSIPDHDLVYSPGHDRLARLDTSFYALRKEAGTREGTGHRLFTPTWGEGVGGTQKEGYPAIRTDYVTPAPAGLGKWDEDHRFTLSSLGADSVLEVAPGQTYTAGKRYPSDWFKPVNAPRFGEGLWRPSRTSNGISWSVPAWSGGSDGHIARSPGGSAASELRSGEKSLGTGAYAGYSSALPTAEQEYTLTLKADRDNGTWAGSTATDTTWTFRSGAPPRGTPKQEIPLLDLGYDVDTDLRGQVRAGSRVPLGLSSSSYTSGVTATGATLQVSYDDGKSWQPATLKRSGDGKWSTTLSTPRHRGGWVSLRATAEGPDGLTVTQDVIRAFGLK